MISIKRLGGKYYLDLDRYISFISDVTTSERLTNSVITSTYSDDLQSNDGDMSMLTKEIVETKGNGGGNELFHQIRYEIIKNLVVSLTSGGYTVDGEISVDDDDDSGLNTIEQKLAFNTLLEYGILKERLE